MLKEIALVTITVSNLAEVESAWQQHFDYGVAARGEISTELAAHWDTEDYAGRDYIIMQPAAEPDSWVRLIEDKAVADYTPMTSHGWNATELLVAEVDPLAEQMRGTTMEVIGEPKDLWPAPNAPRVMQALGPGRELLYLTRNDGAAKALGLADAMPKVDRPFIMVVGGPSMEAFNEFYGGKLGLKVDPPQDFKITMISKANKLPIDTTYPLSIVNIAPGYLIELDELPDSIGPREVNPGNLPPGVAVVSFTVDELPGDDVAWVSKPTVLNEFPYNGRKVGLIRGPAGELIELICPAND